MQADQQDDAVQALRELQQGAPDLTLPDDLQELADQNRPERLISAPTSGPPGSRAGWRVPAAPAWNLPGFLLNIPA